MYGCPPPQPPPTCMPPIDLGPGVGYMHSVALAEGFYEPPPTWGMQPQTIMPPAPWGLWDMSVQPDSYPYAHTEACGDLDSLPNPVMTAPDVPDCAGVAPANMKKKKVAPPPATSKAARDMVICAQLKDEPSHISFAELPKGSRQHAKGNRRRADGRHSEQPPPQAGSEEYEAYMHRVSQRSKQIGLGKSTQGYQNYINSVSREDRKDSDPMHPSTPRSTIHVSKRCWDALVRQWRRSLHLWDDVEEEGPHSAPLAICDRAPSGDGGQEAASGDGAAAGGRRHDGSDRASDGVTEEAVTSIADNSPTASQRGYDPASAGSLPVRTPPAVSPFALPRNRRAATPPPAVLPLLPPADTQNDVELEVQLPSTPAGQPVARPFPRPEPCSALHPSGLSFSLASLESSNRPQSCPPETASRRESPLLPPESGARRVSATTQTTVFLDTHPLTDAVLSLHNTATQQQEPPSPPPPPPSYQQHHPYEPPHMQHALVGWSTPATPPAVIAAGFPPPGAPLLTQQAPWRCERPVLGALHTPTLAETFPPMPAHGWPSAPPLSCHSPPQHPPPFPPDTGVCDGVPIFDGVPIEDPTGVTASMVRLRGEAIRTIRLRAEMPSYTCGCETCGGGPKLCSFPSSPADS